MATRLARTVTLARRGPFVTFDPAGPAADALRTLRTTRPEVPPGGTAAVKVAVPLVGVLRDPDFYFPAPAVWAGLEGVARCLMRDAGLTVRGPAEVMSRLVINSAAAGSRVAAFAARVPRGLVRYARGDDPFAAAADLCRAFRRHRVLVVVRRRRDANALADALHARGLPVALITGRYPGDARRITVALLGATGKAEVEKADLVVVTEALHNTWDDPLTEPPAEPFGPATAVGLMDRLKDAGRHTPAGAAAVIGFLPAGRALSLFEHARLWQLYGPDELTLRSGGRVPAAVAFALTTVKLTRASHAVEGEPAEARAVARDPVRTRRLARVALALAVGDVAKLRSDVPALAGAGGTIPRRVLVLAADIDQAKALGTQLPGWPVVTGLAGPVASAGFGTGVVASVFGAERLPAAGFDAVVRADPGRGLPPLPDGWLASAAPRGGTLLVVDARDCGRDTPALWSRQRRRAYNAAGWSAVGPDPDPDRAAYQRFAAQVLDAGAES
jgi:hypothetical protein